LGGEASSVASVFPSDVSITFGLDLVSKPDGFSIKSIKTYASWDDGRDGQEYTVQYATVANPTTFIAIGSAARFNPTAFPIGNVNGNEVYNATGDQGNGWYGDGSFTRAASPNGSLGYAVDWGDGPQWEPAPLNNGNVTTLVELTDSSGILAVNVAALRFVFPTFESGGTAYREIVVEEVAPTDTTAPTVSSVAITSATGIAASTLNAGDVVSVTVTMSEATTVTGTPNLALTPLALAPRRWCSTTPCWPRKPMPTASASRPTP
jgi:hypothetical protein